MNDEMKHLVSRTKEMILLLNESEMYLKKRATESYVKELDLIREDIVFISNNYQEEAKNLMIDFINASCSVFGRVTDKDFVIENLFQKCVEDLVGILAKTPSDIQEIVDIVYKIICMYDSSYERRFIYGHCFNNDAVSTFKGLLSKDNGFGKLRDRLTERLSKTKKKERGVICRIEEALDEIKNYEGLS
jgi:hypothetical protein